MYKEKINNSKFVSQWDKLNKKFVKQDRKTSPMKVSHKYIKKEKIKYEITRILPPGKVRYVFSSKNHIL